MADTKTKEVKEKKPTGMVEVLAGNGITTDNIVIPMGSDKQRLMAIMSNMAQICGFVVPTGSRQDLSLQKVKDTEDYKLTLVEKMNKKVNGVIISYPEELKDAIDKASSDAVSDTVRQLEQETETLEYIWAHKADLKYTVKVFPIQSALSFIARYCFYTIAEAPAIFAPFKKSAGKDKGYNYFTKAADMKEAPYYYLDNKVNFYIEKIKAATDDKKKNSFIAKLKDLSAITPLMSSYRGAMLPAPENCVALADYVVESDFADVAAANDAYVQPLFKSAAGAAKFDHIPGGVVKKAVVDGRPVYTASVISATGVDTAAVGLGKHWFGNKDVISTVALVKKTVTKTPVVDKEGKPVMGDDGLQKIRVSVVPVKKVNETAADFDAAMPATVKAATRDIITGADIKAFADSIAKKETAKTKKAKSGKAKHISSYGYDMAAVLTNIERFADSMIG